jgi:oligoribonuclease
MTGLDLVKDHLIEIAVLITDGDLNIIAEVSVFILICHNPSIWF